MSVPISAPELGENLLLITRAIAEEVHVIQNAVNGIVLKVVVVFRAC